ncbi:Kef-type potassium/proton antiporter, CPA2 family [Candidatus Thermokryptus mobilis]|uniref:Kef-type potassium/proton antiporter, CPA2 family n=1 Tax=Candidatus Thermokryptus mobilis TaxID=1643428 RepID=A0A0S4MU77_9BACT|nr:cation:proton antiporter [Candidatus Thermokryptus mobilis]CUU02281.1 Kef-type potassium/proton antiporter, CPA2 family [Candidatus Thermokryptus mobilis]
MNSIEFLKTFAIILGTSTVIVYTLHKMKMPPVIGFLISGFMIGPYAIGLVKNVELVELFAEIGIILLLFVLGIELSPTKLFEMRRFLLFAGGLQVLLTVTLCAIIALTFMNLAQAILAGMLIALSSTAIVLKHLSDKGEVDTPHGKIIIGILLFQDLFAIFMVGLIPSLAGGKIQINLLLEKIAMSLVVISLAIWSSKKLIPWLLFQIVKSRIRDLVIVSVLFLCFSVALLISELGFSLALGAFIAGLLISESEYAHQVTADVTPLRESFMAIFFISIGMLLDFKFVKDNLVLILLISLSVILLKLIANFLSIRLAGGSMRVSLISALALAQMSEFSFVLVSIAQSHNMIDQTSFNFIISISIITMLFSPLILLHIHKIAEMLSKKMSPSVKVQRDELEKVMKLDSHVIIVGFGINGRNVAKILKDLNIPYVILELNPITVREMKKQGEPIYLGDATSIDVLKSVGIDKAKLIVIAISDPTSTRRIVTIARSVNPDIYIIVRTRYVSEIEELKKLGANEVIPEEFETSIQISSRVLDFFNVPLNIIKDYTAKLRENSYVALLDIPKNEFSKLVQEKFPSISFNLSTYLVLENSKSTNKSIGELNFRAQTGATIIAVKRGEEIYLNPSPSFILKPGDLVLALGKPSELEKAVEFFKNLNFT